jgi:hypothetical protein
VVISSRPQVVEFCRQMLDELPDDVRAELRLAVHDALAGALHDHTTWSFAGYAPVETVTVQRQAAFSVSVFEEAGAVYSSAELWLCPEDGDDVSLDSSVPSLVLGRDADSFSDLRVPADSYAGRHLRDAALLGLPPLAAGLTAGTAPYWRYVSTLCSARARWVGR